MRLLTPLLLLLAVALLVRNAYRKSPTVNKQSHLFRGATYVMAGVCDILGSHLLVATIISALPHVTIPDLRLPVTEPAWTRGERVLAGNAFVWRPNPNPQRLMGIRREIPASAITYQACWPSSI